MAAVAYRQKLVDLCLQAHSRRRDQKYEDPGDFVRLKNVDGCSDKTAKKLADLKEARKEALSKTAYGRLLHDDKLFLKQNMVGKVQNGNMLC